MKRWWGRSPLGPESLLEGLWLVTAVAVPLAMSPWGANAFELPKALLLRLLVLLMALAALLKTLETADRTPKAGGKAPVTPSPQRSDLPISFQRPALPSGLVPVLAALFSLATVLTLATLFSVDPRASLWGSYDRQQGLLTLAAYLALFALTASHLRSRAQVERLWLALVWGSLPVVAYGLLQAAGLDPLSWQTDAASGVLSTLGRANFLGSYLVLVASLTVARLAVARRRRPCALLLSGQLACLALTQARAAWLGMGVALAVGLLAWAVTGRSPRRRVAALALALLVLLVLAVGFVALLNLPAGPLAPLAGLPGLERLAALADAGSGSSAARLTTWRATLPLIGERMVLGYGPETMPPVFARIFPPELVYYQGRHVSVDRAHNLWLDTSMSAGLTGILALGALLVAWGWLAWQGRPRHGERWDRAIWAGVLAAVAGHLVDQQFSFDLTASATVFWLVLAMGAAVWARQPLPARRRARVLRQERLWYLVPPALLVLVLAWLVCARPLLADLAHQRSRDALSEPGTRLAASMNSVRLWPLEPLYRVELASALLQNGQAAAAEAQLAAARELSPDHPGLWAAIGGLYAGWGEVAPEQFPQAEVAYRRALELAPNVATYHTALGLILARQGRTEEGLAELDRAVALDATDSVAYRHLADLYLALGRRARAAWALHQAERWERETMQE